MQTYLDSLERILPQHSLGERTGRSRFEFLINHPKRPAFLLLPLSWLAHVRTSLQQHKISKSCQLQSLEEQILSFLQIEPEVFVCLLDRRTRGRAVYNRSWRHVHEVMLLDFLVIKLDITRKCDPSWLPGHQAVGASSTMPSKDVFFGSTVHWLPLSFGNMHAGLVSVNLEVIDVRFFTKLQFKRRRFLGSCKPILDVACSTSGFWPRVIG